MIVLNEGAFDPGPGEGIAVIDFGEPATGIVVAFGADELDGGRHSGVNKEQPEILQCEVAEYTGISNSSVPRQAT